tara:strand:+ start:997 stop:1299 length:303 start_codon:yes stop_codon:yes gene_type:complete
MTEYRRPSMAKSPNTTPINGISESRTINGISYSWTQPYPSMEGFFVPKELFERTTQEEQEITVSNELARLDHLEEEVQSMLTYPDAEAIINKITKEIKDD